MNNRTRLGKLHVCTQLGIKVVFKRLSHHMTEEDCLFTNKYPVDDNLQFNSLLLALLINYLLRAAGVSPECEGSSQFTTIITYQQ